MPIPDDLISRCDAVPGYMGIEELHWLWDQAGKSPVCLEMGVWKGRSTTTLCLACPGVVVSVDSWMGSPGFEDDTKPMVESAEVRLSIIQEAFKNLQEFRESGKLVLLPLRTDQLWDWLVNRVFANFTFIDAGHDYQSVLEDIQLALNVTHGIIGGHDYDDGFPGVKQAVDEAFGDRVRRGPGSIWYVETHDA